MKRVHSRREKRRRLFQMPQRGVLPLAGGDRSERLAKLIADLSPVHREPLTALGAEFDRGRELNPGDAVAADAATLLRILERMRDAQTPRERPRRKLPF